MAFYLERKESVEEGVKRVLGEQIGKALEELPNAGDPGLHEAIHQARKRCKKARALYRLVRRGAPDAYRRENRRFRDCARDLSAVRDAEAMTEAYDAVMKRFADTIENERDFSEIRHRLTLRRNAIAEGEVDLPEKLEAFREGLENAKSSLDDWALEDDGFDVFGKGVCKTYKRGRKAMAAAAEARTDAAFHEWRKRVKYHRFHIRMARKMWQRVLPRLEKELDRLGELLGDDHDLAVLTELLHAEAKTYSKSADIKTFLALAAQRRRELQKAAFAIGERAYALKPKERGRLLECYWGAWKSEKEPALLPS